MVKETIEAMLDVSIPDEKWKEMAKSIAYGDFHSDIQYAFREYLSTGDDSHFTEKQIQYIADYYEPNFRMMSKDKRSKKDI